MQNVNTKLELILSNHTMHKIFILHKTWYSHMVIIFDKVSVRLNVFPDKKYFKKI